MANGGRGMVQTPDFNDAVISVSSTSRRYGAEQAGSDSDPASFPILSASASAAAWASASYPSGIRQKVNFGLSPNNFKSSVRT